MAIKSRMLQPVKVKTFENPLISKLKNVPPGQKHWHDYQSICKDILTFCFVPPLLNPIEESTTQNGIHRRDIIYRIPLGEGGFWGYLQSNFSASAIIVDAKNYSNELPKDQVFMISKYFGHNKLGNFGIIVSRKEPSKSAKKQQIDMWANHKEMIICLSDADLEQMVFLKEISNNPQAILDDRIFEIRGFS